MASFKPTKIVKTSAVEQLTPENVYWKQFQTAAVLSGTGQITNIDFSPEEPFNFAVSRSSKVEIYDHHVCEVVSTLTKFKCAAYGAVFRNDGKLLGVGCEDGQLQVFNLQQNSHSALRAYSAHKSAVHCCKFVCSGRRLVSFGDDRSVKCWDIASAESVPLVSFEEHNDHVRCGATGWTNESLIISGCYDHCAKVFDIREPEAVTSVNHGSPIEEVLLFPNDSLFATAGGTVVKVWDMVGGRQIAQLSQHHKTVTALKLGSENRRLLTAGLDKHLKVYDIKTFEQVHNLTYPAPILSMGISRDDKVIAVGMAVGGLLSIERRRSNQQIQHLAKNKSLNTYYAPEQVTYQKSNITVSEKETSELRRYDNFLRRFQHSRALTYVISSKYFSVRRPEVVVSLLRELGRRGALSKALAGRDSASLAPVLRFVAKHLSEQRFLKILIGTALLILDMYEKEVPSLEPRALNLFKKLTDAVSKEVKQQKEMMLLLGSVGLILNHCAKYKETTKSMDEIFGRPVIERITCDY